VWARVRVARVLSTRGPARPSQPPSPGGPCDDGVFITQGRAKRVCVLWAGERWAGRRG